MNTLARVQALAKAAAGFPELSPPDERDLLEVVRLELGHEEILDDFQEYGGHLARALAPRTILHIVSGNTPHAALQTMIRGLLLGAENLVKFPAAGLGEIERFADRLPPELAQKLACARTLDEAWLEKADAWVVFGNDRTISHFRARCPAGKIFQAHGPRASLAVIFSELDSWAGLARDVALFDQLGCLSPQAVYVAGDAVGLAARLAVEIERYLVRHPAGTLALEDAAAVAHARETALFERPPERASGFGRGRRAAGGRSFLIPIRRSGVAAPSLRLGEAAAGGSGSIARSGVAMARGGGDSSRDAGECATACRVGCLAPVRVGADAGTVLHVARGGTAESCGFGAVG